MEKTIGGDRLGSGKKMKAYLHNYERSTHDLGNVFRSSMTSGVLIPFYKKIALNGDTWTIDLNALVRTMPATGPLFGSYKLQMDFFEVPIRLYNGVLHNNWTKIGMDMSKVKLPKVEISTTWENPEYVAQENFDASQISNSALAKYLGISGLGTVDNTNSNTLYITRQFNAVPFLAYYDIFKNYYSNKQEKNAYVIKGEVNDTQIGNIAKLQVKSINGSWLNIAGYSTEATTAIATATSRKQEFYISGNDTTPMPAQSDRVGIYVGNEYKIHLDGNVFLGGYDPILVLRQRYGTQYYYIGLTDGTHVEYTKNQNVIDFKIVDLGGIQDVILYCIAFNGQKVTKFNTIMQEFELENIDIARQKILQATALNTTFGMNSLNFYPYKAIFEEHNGYTLNKTPMNGIVVKTYQSDIFNNWLSSEWIDGLNGISAVTSVDTSGGSFTIDALSLAHKVYNMLNRIAVSGGTYQDWQEAVWGEDAVRMAESPIYAGGMSGVIAFEEVVSTADTETAAAGDQPLGSLAGKGILTDTKGGHIELHIKEPSYIMGIVSITPYIDYSQGNDFDMTELDSINDLHKPALDQIGFQNLMLERAAWFGKVWDDQASDWIDKAVGKTPAWIEYMTSVNKVYGDFADPAKLGFMVLNRNYEANWKTIDGVKYPVADFTTYINPEKYNYQFADTKLTSQNFWVQILIKAIARRKMSAKIIPNL